MSFNKALGIGLVSTAVLAGAVVAEAQADEIITQEDVDAVVASNDTLQTAHATAVEAHNNHVEVFAEKEAQVEAAGYAEVVTVENVTIPVDNTVAGYGNYVEEINAINEANQAEVDAYLAGVADVEAAKAENAKIEAENQAERARIASENAKIKEANDAEIARVEAENAKNLKAQQDAIAQNEQIKKDNEAERARVTAANKAIDEANAKNEADVKAHNAKVESDYKAAKEAYDKAVAADAAKKTEIEAANKAEQERVAKANAEGKAKVDAENKAALEAYEKVLVEWEKSGTTSTVIDLDAAREVAARELLDNYGFGLPTDMRAVSINGVKISDATYSDLKIGEDNKVLYRVGESKDEIVNFMLDAVANKGSRSAADFFMTTSSMSDDTVRSATVTPEQRAKGLVLDRNAGDLVTIHVATARTYLSGIDEAITNNGRDVRLTPSMDSNKSLEAEGYSTVDGILIRVSDATPYQKYAQQEGAASTREEYQKAFGRVAHLYGYVGGEPGIALSYVVDGWDGSLYVAKDPKSTQSDLISADGVINMSKVTKVSPVSVESGYSNYAFTSYGDLPSIEYRAVRVNEGSAIRYQLESHSSSTKVVTNTYDAQISDTSTLLQSALVTSKGYAANFGHGGLDGAFKGGPTSKSATATASPKTVTTQPDPATKPTAPTPKTWTDIVPNLQTYTPASLTEPQKAALREFIKKEYVKANLKSLVDVPGYTELKPELQEYLQFVAKELVSVPELAPRTLKKVDAPAEPQLAEVPEVTKRTHFVDENGNELLPPVDSHENPAKIPGYEFVETKKDGEIITHVYKEVKITRFVDEAGNPLSPEVSDHVDPIAIDGYDFVETIEKDGVRTHVYRVKPVKVPVSTPQVPKTPVATVAPAKPATPAPVAPASPAEVKTLPETGDAGNVTAVLGMTMSALGLTGVAKRRRK